MALKIIPRKLGINPAKLKSPFENLKNSILKELRREYGFVLYLELVKFILLKIYWFFQILIIVILMLNSI